MVTTLRLQDWHFFLYFVKLQWLFSYFGVIIICQSLHPPSCLCLQYPEKQRTFLFCTKSVTVNPRLIFIPYKTDSSPARGCPDQSIDACELDDACQDVDSFGKKTRDFFMSSYLYCLILGSISLMSGLLLSIIAFHGLNSNNITPIMGKENTKAHKYARQKFFFNLRSSPGVLRTWFRRHWILPLFEQTEIVEGHKREENAIQKFCRPSHSNSL